MLFKTRNFNTIIQGGKYMMPFVSRLQTQLMQRLLHFIAGNNAKATKFDEIAVVIVQIMLLYKLNHTN